MPSILLPGATDTAALTADADLPTAIGLHVLTRLRGRHRRQVLDRTVAGSARSSDPRPLGGWTV